MRGTKGLIVLLPRTATSPSPRVRGTKRLILLLLHTARVASPHACVGIMCSTTIKYGKFTNVELLKPVVSKDRRSHPPVLLNLHRIDLPLKAVDVPNSPTHPTGEARSIDVRVCCTIAELSN